MAEQQAELDLEVEPRQESIEIEVDEKVNKQENSSNVEVEQDNEQEQAVSESKKRIDRLTKKMREAERREQAAIDYAKKVKQEADSLKGRLKTLDQGYVTEYSQRVDSELAAAEASLRQAMQSGDTDATIEAQKKLSELSVAKERVRLAKAQQPEEEKGQEVPAQQPQQPAQYQAPPPQAQKPDPKAEDWAQKNNWFGQDEAMTYAAFGIHKKLIEEEGFDPKTDEYYSELDERLKTEFPHKLGNNGDGSRRPAQNVASVTRTAKGAGRKRRVKLSSSQVAMANKLGVPLEEYAKYVKE
jgi:GH15 family glucan-1,4-alpha-glucosidase